MLDRLERDRSLAFHLDGQSILVDDYLEVRPAARARLDRLVATGRLSLGPWYVLADELLAGDEPLVRNLLVGRRRAAAHGGWLPVGYSPDAFGHPDALPAILRGFGIETALLWRGHGRAPSDPDLLRWVGPDGSDVLVHHLPPAGYEYGAELPADRAAMRKRWATLGPVLESRAVTPVLLVMNGADHHALQPDLPAAVRSLRAVVGDAPVTVGTLDSYFTALREALVAADGTSRLRKVEGELRWSYGYAWTLQGVAATRTALKQRIAEGAALLVRWAEPQAALTNDPVDRRPLLEHAWRGHLANLSHDVLAGSVVDAVAEDVAVRARQVVEDARGVLCDALDARLGQDAVRRRREPGARRAALIVVNPSPRPRRGVLETTLTFHAARVVVGRPGDRVGLEPRPAFHLVSTVGASLPAQVLDVREAHERLDSPRNYPEQDRVWAVRVALEASRVPAFGLMRVEVREGAGPDIRPTELVAVRGRTLRASWGEVTPRAGGFRLRVGARTLALEPLLTSARDLGDTYTIQPAPGDRALHARWGAPRPVWRGPLVAAVARPFRIGSRASGMLYVRVDAGSPLVRFVVEGTNGAGNHRIRLVLPLRGRGGATADMAYGAVTRPRVRADPADYPAEWPTPTAPMHRWVSAGPWTVCARGLHEYELLPDGSVAITLLRAVGDLSRGGLPARPGHAAWPAPTPDAQGLGPFRAEIAVGPIGVGETSDALTWDAVDALAEEFHAPLAGLMYRSGIDLPAEVGGPRLEGSGLAFRALKPRDDGPGVVARCVNLTRQRRVGRWIWPTPVTRAYRARLDESVEYEVPLSADRRTMRFDAAPRAIVTLIVEP